VTAPSFDAAVLIGRFQPFHHGHAGLLRCALDTAPRVVVVLGSSYAAPSPRNPFSAAERAEMIRSSLSAEDAARVVFLPQRDVWNGPRWAREVAAGVEAIAEGSVALVGYAKDDSSAYLRDFPRWAWVDAGRQGPLDATPLRDRILSSDPWERVRGDIAGSVPEAVRQWLDEWVHEPRREVLAGDRAALEAYRQRWGAGPFLAADAVVVSHRKVLLVRRGSAPGKGQLAVPGGFLEPWERFEDGARRECMEETGLDLSDTPTAAFAILDHPRRSLRARIVSHAFLFRPDWPVLPVVSGRDDALEARWHPIDSLAGRESEFFEDHFHLLDRLLGLLDPEDSVHELP
jgi:bifunctional NMN adenylyltransferase/nudix hydrolase